MARPKKNNADYFSHDADMRNDPKIKYIRQTHGLEGYAVYCMMLEHLTDCDNFEITRSSMNIKLLSGDFTVDSDVLKSLVSEMIEVELFELKDDILSSPGLKKRLQPVLDKRNRSKAAAEKRKSGNSGNRNTTSGRVSVTETPQSKVKESKVKENTNKGERGKPSAPRPKKFVPPSLSEVKAYMGKKVDAKTASLESEKFILFYSSKNRMVGKNKMSNWKSAAGGWLARRKDGSFKTATSSTKLTGTETYSPDNR